MDASALSARTSMQKTNLLAFGLFLLAMPLFAFLIVSVDSHRILKVLGWSKNPGWGILLVLIALALFGFFHRESLWRIFVSSALFILPVCLDTIVHWLPEKILPLPVAVWLLAAFLPLFIGASLIYRMRLSPVVKFAYLVAGAYIQSVYMYNGLNGGQHMGFFGGGWIT